MGNGDSVHDERARHAGCGPLSLSLNVLTVMEKASVATGFDIRHRATLALGKALGRTWKQPQTPVMSGILAKQADEFSDEFGRYVSQKHLCFLD